MGSVANDIFNIPKSGWNFRYKQHLESVEIPPTDSLENQHSKYDLVIVNLIT